MNKGPEKPIYASEITDLLPALKGKAFRIVMNLDCYIAI